MKKTLFAMFLSVTLIFGIGAAFNQTLAHQFKEEYENLDPQTKEKVDEVLDNLKKDLADLDVELPKQHAKFDKLDEDAKQKVKEIMQQMQDGNITKEEADAQLKELGVELPDHHRDDMLAKLDDETKEKVKQILNQIKNGSLTKEDAEAKLKELGVSFPKHQHDKKDPFADLDTDTKEKVDQLLIKAQSQLKELGYDIPKEKIPYLLK